MIVSLHSRETCCNEASCRAFGANNVYFRVSAYMNRAFTKADPGSITLEVSRAAPLPPSHGPRSRVSFMLSLFLLTLFTAVLLSDFWRVFSPTILSRIQDFEPEWNGKPGSAFRTLVYKHKQVRRAQPAPFLQTHTSPAHRSLIPHVFLSSSTAWISHHSFLLLVRS